MTNYKIVATDLDGTLLDNKHLLAKENEECIIDLIGKDHYFVMNSGALPKDARMILKLTKIGINDKTKWFIGLNGIVIYNFKTDETFISLKDRDKESILKEANNYKKVKSDVVTINGIDYLHYITNDKDIWYGLMSTIYASYLQDNTDKLKGFKDLINIMNHYDKTNWTLKDIIYFGDNLNDIPVFEDKTIKCVAVENAIDEIKQLAADITSSNEDKGFANYIKKNVYD